MSRPDFTKIRLFKYLSAATAKKTLSTGGLRLSQPSSFNDPFDMRIDEVLGLDFRQFVEQQKLALIEFLEGPDGVILRSSELGRKAALIKEALSKASPEQRKTIRDELVATPLEQIYNFESFKKSHNELIGQVQHIVDRCGVFCMTKRHDSLLMWSHYTQSHQGAVFEFGPNVEMDSALCASKPVRYQKERPLIYRNPSDLVRRALAMSTAASADQILDDLVFTKSPEWEYEQEMRLAIPDFVPEGSTYGTLKLEPTELVGVYFGCRITSSDKAELTKLARSVNNTVEIYQAHLSPREYALVFEPIETS
jgi:hypothetical protein